MTTPPMTAEELLYLSLPDKRTELVRGRLIVREPAGSRHGAVAARLAYLLMGHVEATHAGRVYAAETGFTIARDPDTVRAPDVAFVAAARLPPTDPAGFFDGAPDLAVEVLSADDHPAEVLRKVADWLSASARLVWVVDTERRTARVYRGDGTETLLGEDGILGGEDVLPGFVCPLRELLFAS
jgi:Uma2 family endonuclease